MIYAWLMIRKAANREKKSEPPWKKTECQDFLRLIKQEGKSSLLEIGAGAGWDSLFFQEKTSHFQRLILQKTAD